ncbi:MAG: DUF2461 domain-containing protein [Bacteroidales bacterium]|nr:DUF2461 domain-containing protein [Bacteroidales bacterium]
MNLHPDTMPFFTELTVNNNRPWFNEHKERWLAIKAVFEEFTQALIDEMVHCDETLVGLTAKNSVYRIYRDTRFSPDKTPYKTHIACFLSSWGAKNSGVPGYYFQMGTEEAYGLEGTCNLGGGIFMPEPDALAAIRQEIFYCPEEFEAIISAPSYRKYFGSEFFTFKKLQRVPKGYPADWEHADWLKYKDYCTTYTMPQRVLEGGNLLEEVLKVWKASVPLNKFIQRAMEELH